MTGGDARDWLMRRLYQDSSAPAPAAFHYDVAGAINAALQEMHKAPLGESWRRMEWSFTTAPGTADYTLAREIANVLGDVTCDGNDLAEVEGDGNFRRLNARFGAPLSGRPMYWFVSRLHGGSLQADATVLQMSLFPRPALPYAIAFEAEVEPRHFDACDFENSSTVIPVADSQVESILLPLALWHLSSSTKLVSDRVRQTVEAGRNNALMLLGVSEPSPAKRERRMTA